MSTFSARCSALLDGLSWRALGVVLLFCAMAALEWALSPMVGAVGGGAGEILHAWVSRIPIFMVSGFTVLITALVVLNAAGSAGRQNPLLAIAAAVAGCLAAALARVAIGAAPAADAEFVLTAFVTWFAPAAVLVTGYVFYLHTRAVREQANAEELRRAALEKQQLEARLRLLQAQIEPHFLFNTLANVRRLCQTDAAAGRTMLAQLSRYLRAALPRMRNQDATLADELELVRAYLGVHQVRMGPRLEASVEAPAELLDAPLPPMMLATLVENAIKHGVGPLAEGGVIRVAAVREDEALLLSVADNGRGFAAASGSGMGLANIRARLAALYGPRASLRLEANSPRGVVATVRLPMSAAGAS